MAKKGSITVSMDVGESKTAYFQISAEHADYFGITEDATTAEAVKQERAAHTRQVYDGLTGTVKKTVAVKKAVWYVVGGGISQLGSGKAIKVPTQLESTIGTGDNAKKNIRVVTMRVPAIATNFAIATWINKKFINKKPTFFLTASGVRHPVNVPNVSDLNPGTEEAAP